MAELAHLENMGRELKCPICWSLLKSSVSLPCNHIFCNTCIMESMKSVSDCPVCKVPFRRREVRAAPHMDNLVSIYKSMELSAGTNIFSTQMCPPTQSADVPTDGFAPGNQEKDNIVTETGGKCQKKSKRKGSSEMRKGKEVVTDAKYSPHRSPSKPSFPAKKRVHVTPYPVSETPLRPEKISKLEDPGAELTGNAESNNHDETAPDSVEDALFSPFFWLRGDDGEADGESPQKLSGEQIMETPSPHSAPCFSDMKDSDDDKPTAITPTNKLKTTEADYFDSEMFEWTQRASSPELCSTPQRSQTMAMHSLDKVSQKECLERSVVMATPCAIVPHVDDKVGPIGASVRIIRKKRKCKSNNLSVSRKSSMKNDVVSEDVDGGIAASSEEIVERSSLKSGRKSGKGCHNSGSLDEGNCPTIQKKQNNSVVPEASQRSPNLSAKSKELNVGEKNIMVTDRSNRNIKMNNSKWKRKDNNKSNNAQAKLSKVVDDSANEEDQDQSSLIKSSDMSNSAYKHIKHGKFSRGIERVKEIQKQQLRELNVCGTKYQAMELVESETFVEVAAASINHTSCENNQTLKMNMRVKSTTENGAHNPENIVLRKCEKNHSQIRCAFCQSSNDTEDSGEMMHYFSGKLVASDFNGGVNVIHSHKYCTEWAPDVYFEDEMVINLTAEVSRSRRIKCSCCGVKGAALGCYEKSCRKSFHYTCAKLMRECRWDTQNFVMLCPLHSSIKLPNEVSESSRQSQKRSTPKGPNGSSQASSANKSCDQPRQKWTWPSGSPCKWVLCCSALSPEEKVTVAKFSKLTGAPVSNTWSLEVTHVIASTDSSGAYRRTLKILKGILDGKWILKVDWIKACMEAMEPVSEEKFEVTVDVYGISGGPQLGRLRSTNKQPKIFSGLRFFFSGNYTASYRGFLQDLVLAAGGAILQRKPVSRDHERLLGDTSTCKTIIVFSIENSGKMHNHNIEVVVDHRHSEAQALADASGGTLAASTWIIDSIAACVLQPLT